MEMWFSEFHTPDVKHSIRVNRQLFSRQSDHLIINKFVTFCQHYISVQSKNTAKFRCLKNINSLIVALP